MIRSRFSIYLTILLLPYVFLSFVVSSEAQKVTPIWEIYQQEQLGGELYQTAFRLEEVVVGLTREQIVGIDENGKVSTSVNLLPGQRANLSPDGNFISVMSISGESEFIDLFELKTLNGEIVTSIKPAGTFVNFLVGSDAQMIVGVAVENQPESPEVSFVYHFYNSKGNEIGQAKATNPTGALLAPDGKAFVFNDPQTGLSVYSQDGSRIWSTDQSYRSFAVSSEARRVIGNSAAEINEVVLIEGGKRIASDAFKNPVYNVAISSNGEFTVATDMRTIRFYTNDLKELVERTFEDESRTITSVAVSNNGFVACGLLRDNGPQTSPGQRYTEGQALVLNPDGEIIWQENYDLTLANAWIPTVALIPVDEKQMMLTVRTREKLSLYDVQL